MILAQALHQPALLSAPAMNDAENIWRERVRQAEENYTKASARCCEMLTGNPLDDALEQALREEHETRAAYMHALERLADLLRGV